MLYFSPLSVTDDKQRDRHHPFSFPQCRQAGQNGGGWVGGWGGGAQISRGGLKGAARQKRIATHVKIRRGVGWLRTKVYAACSGGVVCLSLDIGKVWRIFPCVYKIYTLGRFQFHNLLRRNLVVSARSSVFWSVCRLRRAPRCLPASVEWRVPARTCQMRMAACLV